MHKFTLFSLIALVGISFVALVPVRAEDSTASSDVTEHKRVEAANLQKAKDAFTKLEGSTDRKVPGCAVVEAKIKLRVARDGALETKHAQVHEEMVTRVTRLVTQAKADGYDTTTLEANLVTLKTLITQFQTDRDAYLAAIQSSQSYVCGKSEGEFKDAVVAAKADLATEKADAEAIRTFVTDTLKPTIRALKQSASH